MRLFVPGLLFLVSGYVILDIEDDLIMTARPLPESRVSTSFSLLGYRVTRWFSHGFAYYRIQRVRDMRTIADGESVFSLAVKMLNRALRARG
jgi:hypothetical protein